MKNVPTDCEIPDNLSVDQFQEQLYNIFEKKGILQDVRAFLRTQMINVVRGMQTGTITICPQRHMQRMDISNQAVNILISEYLLRQHFSYTLSMFTTEIPLADMVFDFAKRLFSVGTVSVDSTHSKYDRIHFKENDVRDILNILGFPYDSPMKADIIKMYCHEPRQPLLACILITLVNELKEYSECITASDNVRKTPKHESSKVTNTPGAVDPICVQNQNKASEVHWKGKYEKKVQELNLAYGKELNIKMKMAKDKFIQDQATLEMNMQNEWKRREEELKNENEQVNEDCSRHIKTIEHNVNRKKKFLWQLFRSMQEQHKSLKRARDNVRKKDRRLKAKAMELKFKISEGEAILTQKGEELNQKIKKEMLFLEGQMEHVEREKRALSQERRGLDDLHTALGCERTAVETAKRKAFVELECSRRLNKQLQDHCETLKSQRDALKTRGEEGKIAIGKSTQTETPGLHHYCLNNVPETAADRTNVHPSSPDSRESMKQTVVNNLKKWKNVNMTNDLEVQTDVCGIARWEVSIGPGAATELMHQILEHTQEDNRNLRAFLDLQKSQIRELITQKVSLQSELTTANLTLNNLMRMNRASERTLAATPHLLRPLEAARGAGEEVGVTCRTLVATPDPIRLDQESSDKSGKKINKYPVTCRLQMQQSLNESHTMQSADHSQLLNVNNPTRAKLKAKKSHHLPTRVDDHVQLGEIETTHIKEQDQYGEKSARCGFMTEDARAGATDDREQNVDTNKIVNAVRRRFRKLEIEAEAVDKAYWQFRARHSDSTMSYGRCTGANTAAARSSLGTGELTNLQPYASDILSRPIHSSSRCPENLNSPKKNKNIAEVNRYKTITRLLDEPLMNFRKMYAPASRNSESRPTAINNRVKSSTQAAERNVKDCAVSPILSLVSNFEGKISSSNKRDDTPDINQTIKVNPIKNVISSLHKSFEGQTTTHALRDPVNNVSIEILPVAIENYEIHYQNNVNIAPSSDSVIDKANKEKYLRSDLSPRKLDINLNKKVLRENESGDENIPSNDGVDASKQIDESNTDLVACKCRKSGDGVHECVYLDLQGFAVRKADDEAKTSTNGGVIVSVQSILTNEPVLIEPETTDLSKYEMNIETINMEESIITITLEKDNVEDKYENEGTLSKEEAQEPVDKLNVDKPNDHDNVHELKSIPVELTVDSRHLDDEEDSKESGSREKDNYFRSIQKHTDNTNFDSSKPADVEVLQSSHSEADGDSQTSVAKDAGSVMSDLSVPKASSDDSFWS